MKTRKPPKISDAERHKRFVETAHKLDIPDDADLSPDFFKRLVNQHTDVPGRKSQKPNLNQNT